jgi:hypothetical protein
MTDEFPFEVPLHDRMALRVPGKLPQTVLCIEQQIYTWRISEYTEPISYGRHWCYESFEEALIAVAAFVSEPGNEPDGWIRATDFGDGVGPHDRHYTIRVRRSHVIDGERVVTVDEPD